MDYLCESEKMKLTIEEQLKRMNDEIVNRLIKVWNGRKPERVGKGCPWHR